jgi:hypothetical protein
MRFYFSFIKPNLRKIRSAAQRNMFPSLSQNRTGVQIDLLYSRADDVITLCEMKCSVAPIGASVVKETEKKAELLRRVFPSKTIQCVLIVHGTPSRDVARSGYFYRIVQSNELMAPITPP